MSHAPAIITRAIMALPHTPAPPSYNGMGWLVVTNLGTSTGAAWIGGMAFAFLVYELWRHRRLPANHPARIFCWMCLLGAFCFTVRCGAVALVNWAWNPADPTTNAWALTVKNFTDPVAMACGIAAIALTTLAWESLMERLFIEPPEAAVIWARIPMLKRPVCIVALAFVAAIAVVSFR